MPPELVRWPVLQAFEADEEIIDFPRSGSMLSSERRESKPIIIDSARARSLADAARKGWDKAHSRRWHSVLQSAARGACVFS